MIDYGYGYLILHGTSLFKSEQNIPVTYPPSPGVLIVHSCSSKFLLIIISHHKLHMKF